MKLKTRILWFIITAPIAVVVWTYIVVYVIAER